MTAAVPSTDGLAGLGRSLLRASWAGVVLGADRVLGLAGTAAGRDGRRPTAAVLDALARAARRGMGPLPQAMVDAGDQLQSEYLDLAPDLSPSGWGRMAARLASDAVAALGVLRPDDEGEAVREELWGKLEVYRLVRRGSASLGEAAAEREVFEAAVERALWRDPHRALWTLEGLGHGHASAVLAAGPDPRAILAGARVPDCGQVMVHLGLGMALAEHVVAALEPDDPAGAQAAVERFVDLCRVHSAPGQADAALESLGLVVRCFFPELVLPIDRALAERGGADGGWLHEYFWHGVGRAMYFLPLHLLPGYGTIPTALRRLEREAPHALARAGGRSGVAYAATLVQLGRPVVLERFVHRHPEAVDRTFAEGMVSAVLLRRRTTPAAPELDAFLRHVPADREAVGRWRTLVAEPVHEVLFRGGRGEGAVLRRLADPPGPGREERGDPS